MPISANVRKHTRVLKERGRKWALQRLSLLFKSWFRFRGTEQCFYKTPVICHVPPGSLDSFLICHLQQELCSVPGLQFLLRGNSYGGRMYECSDFQRTLSYRGIIVLSLCTPIKEDLSYSLISSHSCFWVSESSLVWVSASWFQCLHPVWQEHRL